jgi:hypothetical protein
MDMVGKFAIDLIHISKKKSIVSMPLNCPGMYRGVIREDGIPKTAIFSDEEVG